MSAQEAYITVLINDGYLPGALLLARLLKEKYHTQRKIVLLTAGISSSALKFLSKVYDEITPIDDHLLSDTHGSSQDNLKLLERLDLDVSLNKLHIFNQTNYKKLVYLDLDILPLKSLDDLFDVEVKKDEIAGSPDQGWPDIFNSGLLAFSPSQEIFSKLTEKLNSEESFSFDGADQGLLNQHFKDKWVRLPFSYNVTFSNHYEYLPALNFFLKEIKTFHFIGANKPWNSYEFSKFNQMWWDDFNAFFNSDEKMDILSLSRNSIEVKGEAGNLIIPKLINQWSSLTTEDKEAVASGQAENRLSTSKDIISEADSDNQTTPIFPWERYREEPTRVFPRSTDFF